MHCIPRAWVLELIYQTWGIMAGLTGFASHWCSLHLGVGYQ